MMFTFENDHKRGKIRVKMDRGDAVHVWFLTPGE